MHLRSEIKKMVREELYGKTEVGDNVVISRVRRVSVPEMPCISIYSPSETPTRVGVNPYTYEFSTSIDIVIFSKMDECCEETLDRISSDVEDILLNLNVSEKIEGGREIILGDSEITLSGSDDREVLPTALINFRVIYERQVPLKEYSTTESIDLGNDSKGLYEG